MNFGDLEVLVQPLELGDQEELDRIVVGVAVERLGSRSINNRNHTLHSTTSNANIKSAMNILTNEAGQLLMSRTVTPDKFMGLPLVLVANGLYGVGPTDPRWVAVRSICADFVPVLGKGAGYGLTEAPAIGIDSTDPGVNADLDWFTESLRVFSKYLTPGGTRRFLQWDNGPVPASQARPPCGPIVAIDTFGGPSAAISAAVYSMRWTRYTKAHVFGCAMDAVGQGLPESSPSPPVYNVTTATLAELRRVWLFGGVIKAEDVASAMAADTLAPGFSVRTNPALIPYLAI